MSREYYTGRPAGAPNWRQSCRLVRVQRVSITHRTYRLSCSVGLCSSRSSDATNEWTRTNRATPTASRPGDSRLVSTGSDLPASGSRHRTVPFPARWLCDLTRPEPLTTRLSRAGARVAYADVLASDDEQRCHRRYGSPARSREGRTGHMLGMLLAGESVGTHRSHSCLLDPEPSVDVLVAVALLLAFVLDLLLVVADLFACLLGLLLALFVSLGGPVDVGGALGSLVGGFC